MEHFMPERTNDLSGISKPVTEQVNLPLEDHTRGYLPTYRGAPDNVRFAIADKNGGFMAKLREKFFNYARHT